jgi:hypothetical protein
LTVEAFDSGSVIVTVADSEDVASLTDPGTYVVYVNVEPMVATDVLYLSARRTTENVAVQLLLEDVQDPPYASFVITVPSGSTATVNFDYPSGANADIDLYWAIDRIS